MSQARSERVFVDIFIIFIDESQSMAATFSRILLFWRGIRFRYLGQKLLQFGKISSLVSCSILSLQRNSWFAKGSTGVLD